MTLERRKQDRRYINRTDVEERRQSNGRKCLICEKNPYPNYFYCTTCHMKVSREICCNVDKIQKVPPTKYASLI
ncbi:hypothetical protein KAR91_16075 [Candidatus Pacearchaeota archaeon]|nr:hypothetical protein [Candidatus Pacearchaeota archaeon]